MGSYVVDFAEKLLQLDAMSRQRIHLVNQLALARLANHRKFVAVVTKAHVIKFLHKFRYSSGVAGRALRSDSQANQPSPFLQIILNVCHLPGRTVTT